MTGVDIGVCGITGGLIGGILTAYTIEGEVRNIKTPDGEKIIPTNTSKKEQCQLKRLNPNQNL